MHSPTPPGYGSGRLWVGGPARVERGRAGVYFLSGMTTWE